MRHRTSTQGSSVTAGRELDVRGRGGRRWSGLGAAGVIALLVSGCAGTTGQGAADDPPGTGPVTVMITQTSTVGPGGPAVTQQGGTGQDGAGSAGSIDATDDSPAAVTPEATAAGDGSTGATKPVEGTTDDAHATGDGTDAAPSPPRSGGDDATATGDKTAAGDTTAKTVPPTAATTRPDGTQPAAEPDMVTGFTSPSGNITCRAGQHVDDPLSCGIRSFTFDPGENHCAAGQPAKWKWGQLVTLEGGGAGFACQGNEPTAAAGAVLQYGQTSSNERYSCRSEQDGVICVDTFKRRGFRLAQGSFTRLDPPAVDKLGFPRSGLDNALVELDAVGDGVLTVQQAKAVTEPTEGYQVIPGKRQLKVAPDAEFSSIGRMCQNKPGLNERTTCDADTAGKIIAGQQVKPIVETIGIDGVVVVVRELWVA